jgi:hypothetical protein
MPTPPPSRLLAGCGGGVALVLQEEGPPGPVRPMRAPPWPYARRTPGQLLAEWLGLNMWTSRYCAYAGEHAVRQKSTHPLYSRTNSKHPCLLTIQN